MSSLNLKSMDESGLLGCEQLIIMFDRNKYKLSDESRGSKDRNKCYVCFRDKRGNNTVFLVSTDLHSTGVLLSTSPSPDLQPPSCPVTSTRCRGPPRSPPSRSSRSTSSVRCVCPCRGSRPSGSVTRCDSVTIM